MSTQTGSVITGSIIIKEKGCFYNRLVWMNPDGSYALYDKRHLFSIAKENSFFERGKDRVSVKLKGWKICPLMNWRRLKKPRRGW